MLASKDHDVLTYTTRNPASIHAVALASLALMAADAKPEIQALSQ